MNHVLSSSCAVLISAPTQATRPAKEPMTIASAARMPTRIIDQPKGVMVTVLGGEPPTTMAPAPTAATNANAARNTPAMTATIPPTNSLLMSGLFNVDLLQLEWSARRDARPSAERPSLDGT